jgi:SAM-dependent methyltransferase
MFAKHGQLILLRVLIFGDLDCIMFQMTTKLEENFWETEDCKKFHSIVKNEIILWRGGLVNAALLEQYDQGKLKTFLDYGCGNGLVSTMLPLDIKKTLYDINPDMVEIEKLKRYNCEFVNNPDDLPSNKFDASLLSFVLLCTPDEERLTEVLKQIKRVKASDGTVTILDAHPNHVGQTYSWMSSTLPKPLKDMKPGTPFKKRIYTGDKQVSFTDYYWPLSFIEKKLTSLGMRVEDIKEIYDPGFGGRQKNEEQPVLYNLKCT